MFLLLKELLQPDGLPAPTHPLGRGVFNETPSLNQTILFCGIKGSLLSARINLQLSADILINRVHD